MEVFCFNAVPFRSFEIMKIVQSCLDPDFSDWHWIDTTTTRQNSPMVDNGTPAQ